jgi:hypothetical protein
MKAFKFIETPIRLIRESDRSENTLQSGLPSGGRADLWGYRSVNRPTLFPVNTVSQIAPS